MGEVRIARQTLEGQAFYPLPKESCRVQHAEAVGSNPTGPAQITVNIRAGVLHDLSS